MNIKGYEPTDRECDSAKSEALKSAFLELGPGLEKSDMKGCMKSILRAFSASRRTESEFVAGLKANNPDMSYVSFHLDHSHIVSSAVLARLFDWDINDVHPYNAYAYPVLAMMKVSQAMEAYSTLEAALDDGFDDVLGDFNADDLLRMVVNGKTSGDEAKYIQPQPKP